MHNRYRIVHAPASGEARNAMPISLDDGSQVRIVDGSLLSAPGAGGARPPQAAAARQSKASANGTLKRTPRAFRLSVPHPKDGHRSWLVQPAMYDDADLEGDYEEQQEEIEVTDGAYLDTDGLSEIDVNNVDMADMYDDF